MKRIMHGLLRKPNVVAYCQLHPAHCFLMNINIFKKKEKEYAKSKYEELKNLDFNSLFDGDTKLPKLIENKYYNSEDDKQTWFDKIKELAGEMGYAKEVNEFKANPGVYKAHVGDVSTVLRVALTKRTNTPDMYEIMQVLGKDVIESRFEIATENLT